MGGLLYLQHPVAIAKAIVDIDGGIHYFCAFAIQAVCLEDCCTEDTDLLARVCEILPEHAGAHGQDKRQEC